MGWTNSVALWLLLRFVAGVAGVASVWALVSSSAAALLASTWWLVCAR